MEIRAFHQSLAEIILFIEEQVVEERLQRFARGIDFKHDLKIGVVTGINDGKQIRRYPLCIFLQRQKLILF